MAVAFLLLAIFGASGLYLLLRWFSEAKPGDVARLAPWALGGFGAAVALFAALTRQWGLLTGLLIAAPAGLRIWRVMRMRSNRASTARGPSAGQRSQVETGLVSAELDHDTGEMEGWVKTGAFEGRALSSMDIADLLILLSDARATEAQAASLVEAYLDRRYGPAWRRQETGAGGEEAAGDGPMTEAEAREILGIGPEAGEAEIKAAHRRRMKDVHPDSGGSDEEAALLNLAKEILVRRKAG